MGVFVKYDSNLVNYGVILGQCGGIFGKYGGILGQDGGIFGKYDNILESMMVNLAIMIVFQENTVCFLQSYGGIL